MKYIPLIQTNTNTKNSDHSCCLLALYEIISIQSYYWVTFPAFISTLSSLLLRMSDKGCLFKSCLPNSSLSEDYIELPC